MVIVIVLMVILFGLTIEELGCEDTSCSLNLRDVQLNACTRERGRIVRWIEGALLGTVEHLSGEDFGGCCLRWDSGSGILTVDSGGNSWVHVKLWPVGMKSFFHSCSYPCCMDGPKRPKRQHLVYKCEKHVTVVVSLQ